MTNDTKKTLTLSAKKGTISLGINLSSEILNKAIQNIEKASTTPKGVHSSQQVREDNRRFEELRQEKSLQFLEGVVTDVPEKVVVDTEEKSVFEKSFMELQSGRERDSEKKRKKQDKSEAEDEIVVADDLAEEIVIPEEDVKKVKKASGKLKVAPSSRQNVDLKKEITDADEIDVQEYEMLYGGSIVVRSSAAMLSKQPIKKQVRRSENVSYVPSVERGDGKKSIVVEDSITVGALAQEMGLRVPALLKFLMDGGFSANINQSLDKDTILLIGEEFGFEIRIKESDVDALVREFFANENVGEGKPRPPVVTFMGHVDHGKTSLLDAIFSSDVASKESGGITQHIGARAIKTKSGQYISFLDTPGHAAFTEMRARGAKVTDIVVLVVAADDGVMVQTVEAINHIKNANVEIIVAINKIDKPGADLEKIKGELASHGIVVEEYGGNVMMVPVSATKKTNIDKLLETILLQAEMMNLRATLDGNAMGFVVEAKSSKSQGPCATVLIKKGVLKKGDFIVCGNTHGKVRVMMDHNRRSINEVHPSFPAEVFGLNAVPVAGDRFMVVASEKDAEKMIEKISADNKKGGSRSFSADAFMHGATQKKNLSLVIKADVHGSLEAVCGLIGNISHEQIEIDIVYSGVGPISESDVAFAAVAGAKMIAFNVGIDPNARQKIKESKVEVYSYDIIYNLEKEIKEMAAKLLDPKMKEEQVAVLEVRKIFNIKKIGNVVGSYVANGVVRKGCSVKIFRNDVQVAHGKISSLQSLKDVVKEVKMGHECGVVLEGVKDVVEGDTMKVFNVTYVEQKL